MKLLNKYFYILRKIDKRITIITNSYYAETNLTIGYNVIQHYSNFKTIFWICFYEKEKIYKYNLNNNDSIQIKSIKKNYCFEDIKSFASSIKKDGFEIV